MEIKNEIGEGTKVIIEKTSKRLKKRQLISSLIAIGGIVVIPAQPIVGFLMIVVGIVMFVYTRFKIWWQHE